MNGSTTYIRKMIRIGVTLTFVATTLLFNRDDLRVRDTLDLWTNCITSDSAQFSTIYSP